MHRYFLSKDKNYVGQGAENGKLETIFGEKINSVLNAYVDEKGNVDYLTLAMTGDVVKYVESLKTFDMANLRSKNEKLAFWINAYNLTLWV